MARNRACELYQAHGQPARKRACCRAWLSYNGADHLRGPAQPAIQVNGSTTQYLYDKLEVVQELVSGNPVTYVGSLNMDEPLIRDGNEFYLADAIGSIIGLTDPTGTLTTSYSYEPFGRTARQTSRVIPARSLI